MRRTFTAEEKASVFELWKNGTGFSEIANILGSKPGTIFTMLRDTGGIKPHERKRAVAHLTLSEREEIRAGLSAKMSIRAIATALNRSPSTISREVQRNRGRRYYKAVDANNRANRMAKRPKPCLLDQNLPLRKLVLEKLEMKWSPEQISGWLRRTKSRQKTLRISPETIYKTLYFRSREALHHLNIQHLRRSHSLRHGRRHTRKGERGTINIVNGTPIHERSRNIDNRRSLGHWEGDSINIVNGTPIHERSRNIDNRRSLGHWEGDLVSGTKNSHIATLVDRKSRYTIILRLRGKDSVSVNQALTDKFLSLPSELRKSLTWDRGMELARHLEFTVSTGVKVYFCDPQSPWQRGTNENTNGLIRQYFPKKTCLAQYTQHELDLVAAQLNNRPRKTLKFKTPKEIIERGVALTD
ncbi:IS30 family transposase [Escherichia coli]|uniref:IS30 family transposase n=3 Tax=Escherichia coli TaxID=562 RepID=UPI000EF943CA|nr:IS30 family transposase [Escherichia coli]RLX26743.1 IS30 family transposase [Escherichia coli]